jgi:predicted Zn-dependent peptidase
MAMRYGRLYALNIPFEREAEIATTIDTITNDDIQLAARAVLKQISVTGILTPHTENEAQ